MTTGIKRTRTNVTTPSQVSQAQQDSQIVVPTQQVDDNKYDSILAMMEQQQKTIAELQKKVAESNGDISEAIKESKRKYGYDISGNRLPEELFKYKYRVLVHDRKEKVVISSQTIGRPINVRNNNTGKWTNQHDVQIEFHDGTKTEMDVLDYINQFVNIEEFVRDEDIKVIDGKKHYTFHTEKFGTFTTSFIN